MPPSATGKRKVRCPKCTAILTEPETQIYECPICSTYLLAKGYGLNKSPDKRVILNGGDADETQKTTDGGTKLEKASLSNNDGEVLRGETVEIEDIREFDRGIDRQPDSQAPLDSTIGTLAKQSLAKSRYVPSDLSSDTHVEKSGEMPPSHASIDQSSDSDSDLHSESEPDSPSRAAENSKVNEVSEVNFQEGSSQAPRSSELISTLTSSCIKRQTEEMDIRKDAEIGDIQQSLAQEKCVSKDVTDDDKEAKGMHIAVVDGDESRSASKVGSETALSSSLAAGTAKGEDLRNNEDSKEKANVGKFQLFDLSVFGIYNEEAYNEIRRGKVTYDLSTAENRVDGDNNQPPNQNGRRPQLPSIVPEGLLSDKNCSGTKSNEETALLEKHTDDLELPVLDTGAIHVDTGDDGDTKADSSLKKTGARSFREVESAGVNSLDDEKLFPVSNRDIDPLTETCNGDELGLREISSGSASVDVSFGVWRSQPVSKPSNNALELDREYLNQEEGVETSDTEQDTDCSWDDDEELTFSSNAKANSKADSTSLIVGALGSPVVRVRDDESEGKNTTEKLESRLRTTAMQKLLKRDDEQSAPQTQSSESLLNSDSVPFEAPYMKKYSLLSANITLDTLDQALSSVRVQEDVKTAPIRERKPHIGAMELEHAETEAELQRQSMSIAQASYSSSMKGLDVSPTYPEYREEYRRKSPHTDLSGLRKGFELVTSSQEDGRSTITDSAGLEAADSVSQKLVHINRSNPNKKESSAGLPTSQKVDHINRLILNKSESPVESPASLIWKEEARSTHSLSSTEDEGVDGMDSEPGSGPKKAPFRDGSLRPIGKSFPAGEGMDGSQDSREHAGQVFQRPWVGNNDASRQNLGTGELGTSRRSARSRPSNERLSNQGPLMGDGRVRVKEKSFDSEDDKWTGLGRWAQQRTAYPGPDSNPSREGLGHVSHNFSHSTIARDHNNDRSFPAQNVPSRSPHIDYLPKSHGSASDTSAKTYPLQLTPHDSADLTTLREDGLSQASHAHHGVSPACLVCIQQQSFFQHTPMHQSMMPNQCAACAAQASAIHQPVHQEVHGNHMHDLIHSYHPGRHHDLYVRSAESSGQNRSRIGNYNLNTPARRMKHYPPLPGKGAPPFVLCVYCNQLLRVPDYLHAIGWSVQKLLCGACGKVSKFSIPQADTRVPWLSMMSSDREEFVEICKQHNDPQHFYLSGQSSSSGYVSPAHNQFGKGRIIPGQGRHQAWIKNQMTSRSDAHGAPLIRPNLAGRQNQIRPASVPTGSGQGVYGSIHTKEKHASNDTGPYSEDYSSSLSSASGASPGRFSQQTPENKQARPLVTGRTSRDQEFSSEITARTLVNDQGRPRDAPSFSDGLQQKVSENKSRVSRASLQGSVLGPLGDSPRYTPLETYYKNQRSGSWHTEPADGNYSGLNSPRSHIEQAQKLMVAPGSGPGSPLVEDFSHGIINEPSSAHHRPLQKSLGNDLRLTPRSPRSDSQASPPYDSYSRSDSDGRSFEGDGARLPLQDNIKGPTSFAGLLKRSMKDLGRGGQGGGNRRKVVVNGYLISETAVRKAEEQAGPIHSGTYWYDYQAGFWGMPGGPCLGIIMPFIEEFHFPLARDCANGRTGILVNGRELHDKDLEVLASRGLPTSPGKAYILDLSGALFDDVSGRPLKGLGKLAPSIEKRGRGYGMSTSTPMG